ncbi:MAG: histidine kinase [Acidobacteria bacterium]|nr:MAG: histidine kinase [Acidobacteriota bacterium]
MRHRVMDVLLVASPYDSFLLEEAGQLSERVLGEFRNLDLHYGPGLTTVARGEDALVLAAEQRRFNLIITTLHPGDLNAAELAARARAQGLDVPVVALAFDTREMSDFIARNDVSPLHRIFLWQGDARILLAIVKDVEDGLNVAHDTEAAGVQVVLLIEDSVRYYSSFLPVIYGELLHQSQRLTSEGVNVSQKILRMRARPKILLCRTFEEAWEVFTTYRDDVLGIISDVEFPRAGERDVRAGLEFARRVRGPYPDVPVLIQSARPEHEAEARALGADFRLKGSPLLLHELRTFMVEYFGFGDFVFRLPDGREVDRAADLRALEEKLGTVPPESVAYHAERNHFSKWLKARTEFALAQALRPRKMEDYGSVEELRQGLIRAIAEYRRERAHVVVADFDRARFDQSGDFHRIGGGSLGGKARGLAFVRTLLGDARLESTFPGVSVQVPAAVVLATDAFDEFLDAGALRDLAMDTDDEAEVETRFLAADLPPEVRLDLMAYLERAREPLAVRSSSLLEDSRYQPFSGVYETFMLPNTHPFVAVRFDQLQRAVKRVYASTFSRRAKDYIRATSYRLEEEKMAVIVQRVLGARHGDRFYPDFAGVARSYNFYPTPPLSSRDGVAAVALGLGRTVVDNGRCLHFCPRYPQHLLQFSTVRDVLDNSQRAFWALDLGGGSTPRSMEMRESLFDLAAAEADGTLAALGSTFSAENDAVYDGLGRPGVRLVSFAPVLKHETFPLARLLERLLDLGAWGMGAPVEIEFAVNVSVPRGSPAEMGLLQLRPLALSHEREELALEAADPARVLCRSASVLGNGRLEVRDLVVVDALRFDRARSSQAAGELAQLNAELGAEGTAYVLIGVGRWGSRDPWMGIPVAWDQISGARAIVEAGFRDFKIAPSQGSHFFQNLTSFNVGYFTVNPDAGEGFVDWEWLAAQPAVRETACVRHLRFERPVVVSMDGQSHQGLILKP